MWKNKYLWLLVVFAILMAFLAIGLTRNPHEIPSPLIGKNAPDFRLPQLEEGKFFSPADMKGQVWLLNVWASWCVACREEHPLLVQLGQQKAVPIIGLNYKEVRGDGNIDADKITEQEENILVRQKTAFWLAQHGDPYTLSALDIDGRVGIDYGVYGVPETFVIDKEGVIRYKQIGPITPNVLKQKILPLIRELNP